MKKDHIKLDIPQYIDNPNFVTKKSRDHLIQFLGWVCFMGLMLPLITLLLWAFEFTTIQHYIFIDGQHARQNNLIRTSMAIFICSTILLSWASYNWIRFRNNERRKKPLNTPLNQLAQSFDVTVNELNELQKCQNLTLYYDINGKLTHFNQNKT